MKEEEKNLPNAPKRQCDGDSFNSMDSSKKLKNWKNIETLKNIKSTRELII